MKERFDTINEGSFPPDKNRKDYIESSSIYDSSSSLYERNLGIRVEDLKGKKVLDIGGMIGGNFSFDAKNAGVDLVTLDYQNPYGQIGGENVRGIMQQLPFADDTFDVELSHGVMPYLPNYEEEYNLTFKDILRTLKVSGKAILFPIESPIRNSEVFKKVIENFEKICDVSVEEVELPSQIQFDGEGKERHVFRLILIKK